MTSVDLITGFLGAGKTTFIKRYAGFLQAGGERIAVIENEFGMAGVDADILENGNLQVSQLVGGCICCTQKVNFHQRLLDMAREGIQWILVEPSGIYNADEFMDIMESPDIKKCCVIGAVITILDPEQVQELPPEIERLEYSQLSHTGAVVVSKTGGMGFEERERVKAAALALQKRACAGTAEDKVLVFTKPWEELTQEDFSLLSSCGYQGGRAKGLRTDHSKLFNSTTLQAFCLDENDLKRRLEQIMSGCCGKILRVKGCASGKDGCLYRINCTQSRITIEKAGDGRAELNIIGMGLKRQEIKRHFAC